MKIDTMRIVDICLKLAILITLVMILSHMPPTIADVRNAKTDEQKNAIRLKCPFVYVDGSVTADILGTVDVNVENYPLAVEVW